MWNISIKSVASGEIQNVNFTKNSIKRVRFISNEAN